MVDRGSTTRKLERRRAVVRTGCTTWVEMSKNGQTRSQRRTIGLPGGGLFNPANALSVTSQDPSDPTTESHLLGIRLVYLIPEPSTVALLFLGSLGCGFGTILRKQR